jgi:hypothetical protein
MYIPDLPTYFVFYLETICGSSIDTPTTPTPTHFKSLYVPEEKGVWVTWDSMRGSLITKANNMGSYDACNLKGNVFQSFLHVYADGRLREICWFIPPPKRAFFWIGMMDRQERQSQNERESSFPFGRLHHVLVPTEIIFMDNGGNIFVLCEFIDCVNLHIIWSHTNEFALDEFLWNPYRFLISSLGSPTFFLRIAKWEW